MDSDISLPEGLLNLLEHYESHAMPDGSDAVADDVHIDDVVRRLTDLRHACSVAGIYMERFINLLRAWQRAGVVVTRVLVAQALREDIDNQITALLAPPEGSPQCLRDLLSLYSLDEFAFEAAMLQSGITISYTGRAPVRDVMQRLRAAHGECLNTGYELDSLLYDVGAICRGTPVIERQRLCSLIMGFLHRCARIQANADTRAITRLNTAMQSHDASDMTEMLRRLREAQEPGYVGDDPFDELNTG